MNFRLLITKNNIKKGAFYNMKITAEFDSVDTADIVAAELRSQIKGMADISVSIPEKTTHGAEMSVQGFSQAYGLGTTMPIMAANSVSERHDSFSKAVRLSLVCRKEDAGIAKRIIVGHGAVNLRGS
jgi:hypothetical protein